MAFFDNTAFSMLNDEEQEIVKKMMVEECFDRGDRIISEGMMADRFYIVLSCDPDPVVRKDAYAEENDLFDYFEKKSSFIFKTFQEGRLVGETSFFQRVPYSQTVVASGPCRLGVFTYADIENLQNVHPDLYGRLLKTLGTHVVKRLRKSNTMLVNKSFNILQEGVKREYFYNLLLTSLIIIAFFLLASDLIQHFFFVGGKMFDIVFSCLIIFILAACLLVIPDRPQLSRLGMNLEGWRRSLFFSIMVTVVLCVLATVVKYFFLKYGYAFSKPRLFALNYSGFWRVLLQILVYSAFCFPQELVARGILQTSFQNILKNRSPWPAIFLSNLLFASLHLPALGQGPAIVVFFLGLFWGWLYSKQPTLLGVCVSHILVGVYGFHVLGVF